MIMFFGGNIDKRKEQEHFYDAGGTARCATYADYLYRDKGRFVRAMLEMRGKSRWQRRTNQNG